MPLPTVKPILKGKFRPLGDALLVKRLPDPTETLDGLIILPNKMQINLGRGTIVQIGPKVSTHHRFKPGEVVLLPRQLSYPKIMVSEGDEQVLVPTAQIFGVER